MKVFRENGYFMLILANGHHGVLQSFVKHLSVAVIFLQSCPLARAISRRRKKNMETIIESSFLPPSTADSNWRVEKDRLLLIKAVISSQPNIGWCCREKVDVDRHFNTIEKCVPYPVFPSSDHFHFWRFSKKVRSIHVSICFIILHNEMVLKIGSNGCVRNTNFVFFVFGNRSRWSQIQF